MVPAKVVRDGASVDTACRVRSCESSSTGWPITAGAELLSPVHPAVGVAMPEATNDPARALNAPMVWQMAVALTEPPEGIVTVGGSAHSLPCPGKLSRISPLVMTVSGVPVITTVQEE